MEEVTGIELSAFFNQWVNRKGAPELAITTINTNMYAGKYRINISIEQKQMDGKIAEGEEDIKSGRLHSQDDVQKMIEDWTKK